MTGAPVRHHPSDATLLAHAAGQLAQAHRFVVAAHLLGCATCRGMVRRAEQAAGQMLEDLPAEPLPDDVLARTLARLDEPAPAAPDRAPWMAEPDLPAVLGGFAARPLGWLGVGIRHEELLRSEGVSLHLLRVRPNTALPQHLHHGLELTCVLEGSFHDERGSYGPGDLAEADDHGPHRPVAAEGGDCLCLMAVSGRLRFTGALARILQPVLPF
ncbi:ChrR family anti-sigma-E factor [Roseomonas sp. BN140053]|uniref:ChrR family anti-sigma-E factor n=1 Tax=Roseomonas sp. BN140053 TaxID=3391898 RepID=UPI0039E8B587